MSFTAFRIFSPFLMLSLALTLGACGDDDDPVGVDAGRTDGGGGGECATACGSHLEFCGLDGEVDAYCPAFCAGTPDATQLGCFEALRSNCDAMGAIVETGEAVCDMSTCAGQCVNTTTTACGAPGGLAGLFCGRFCGAGADEDDQMCLADVDCGMLVPYLLTDFLPCDVGPVPTTCQERCEFAAGGCFIFGGAPGLPDNASGPYCEAYCSVATDDQLTCFEALDCAEMDPAVATRMGVCDVTLPDLPEMDGGVPDPDGGMDADGGMDLDGGVPEDMDGGAAP